MFVYTNLFILDIQLILMALETHSRWNQPRREGDDYDGDRTRDPSIKCPTRYQLRYGGSTMAELIRRQDRPDGTLIILGLASFFYSRCISIMHDYVKYFIIKIAS